MHKKIKDTLMSCFQHSLGFQYVSQLIKSFPFFAVHVRTLNIAFVSTLGKTRTILSLPKTCCLLHIFRQMFGAIVSNNKTIKDLEHSNYSFSRGVPQKHSNFAYISEHIFIRKTLGDCFCLSNC